MALRDIGRELGGAALERLGRVARRFHEEAPLPVDVLESDDAYLVVFDAPGATSSDVQVSYGEGTVTARIDRYREVEDGYRMRYPGRGLQLDGRADLPEGAAVDPGEARAELRSDGTLHVVLPKADATDGTDAGPDTANESTDSDAATEDGEGVADPDSDVETDS